MEVMVLGVRRDLQGIRRLLVTLTAARDCEQVTGFNAWYVRRWVATLDKVIARYEREARRVRQYYSGSKKLRVETG